MHGIDDSDVHDVDDGALTDGVEESLGTLVALLPLGVVYEEGREGYYRQIEGQEEDALFYELEVEGSAGPAVEQLRQFAGQRQLP